MKLRFENNSIRFRVRRSDLEQLRQQGFVQESVQFAGARFSFQLRIADLTDLTAQLAANSITANIPMGMATTWINTDQVGIYHVQQLGDQTLAITIEKDFPCKDRPEEDRSDTFIELAANSDKPDIC